MEEGEKPKRMWRWGSVVALLALAGLFAVAVRGGGMRHLFRATLSEAVPLRTESMAMPSEVRAIYVTANTAASTRRMNELVAFAHAANMNAMVINVKDGDGLYLDGRMEALAHRLRSEGIYPIARIVVFQDNYLARMWPEEALSTASGTLWLGRGVAWMDPASRPVWDYTVEAAVEALSEGFAEVNFDYVRFPADGDIESIVYPRYDKTVTRAAVIDAFSNYVTEHVKKAYPDAKLSIDIFAHSLLDKGDVGIGQHFVDIARYFDVVCPMIYPSHYAPGNFGFKNPATAPYEVVKGTLDEGVAKLKAAGRSVVIRPWLQDFNMGATYDREKIQAQIKAVSDAGFQTGWMMWNPSNRYDKTKFTAGSDIQVRR